MASISPLAATPSMRDLRDQYLSVLLSGGPRSDMPVSRPMPGPTPITPAPNSFMQQSWTPGSRMSAVTWASPLQPGETDLRVAELTAGLVTASDVEKRQAETIRRLAAKLEHAERSERSQQQAVSFVSGDKKASLDVRTAVQTEDRKGAAYSSHAKVDGGAYRRTEVLPFEDAGEPRAQRSTPRATALNSVSTKSHEVSRRKRTGPRKASDRRSDDVEDLRKRIKELENVAKLAKENEILRAERAAAETQASNMAVVLSEIRQTVSSLVADREQLVATIENLQQTHQSQRGSVRERSGHIAPAFDLGPAGEIAEKDPQHERIDGQESPQSVRFFNFDSDRIAPQSPQLRDSDEDLCENDPGAGGYRTQDGHGEIESQLRAELRSVLDENAALAAELMSLKTRQMPMCIQSDKEISHEMQDMLREIRSEVDVLTCIAQCIQLRQQAADGETQDTLTAFREFSDGSVSITSKSSHEDSEVRPGPANEFEKELKEIISDIVHARRVIAVKYGRWLSSIQPQPGSIQAIVDSFCPRNAHLDDDKLSDTELELSRGMKCSSS